MHVRWSVLRKRVRGSLLAVRALQSRLGHFAPRKYHCTHRVLANSTRQVDLQFATFTFKRDGSFNEVLDLDRLHMICKFDTKYLRIEI